MEWFTCIGGYRKAFFRRDGKAKVSDDLFVPKKVTRSPPYSAHSKFKLYFPTRTERPAPPVNLPTSASIQLPLLTMQAAVPRQKDGPSTSTPSRWEREGRGFLIMAGNRAGISGQNLQRAGSSVFCLADLYLWLIQNPRQYCSSPSRLAPHLLISCVSQGCELQGDLLLLTLFTASTHPRRPTCP